MADANRRLLNKKNNLFPGNNLNKKKKHLSIGINEGKRKQIKHYSPCSFLIIIIQLHLIYGVINGRFFIFLRT